MYTMLKKIQYVMSVWNHNEGINILAVDPGKIKTHWGPVECHLDRLIRFTDTEKPIGKLSWCKKLSQERQYTFHWAFKG